MNIEQWYTTHFSSLPDMLKSHSKVNFLCVVVYIDFSKAFDVVSHTKLIARLNSYAGWYLTGRMGDVSWSLDFGIPLTGTDSNVPGWDTFDPPH